MVAEGVKEISEMKRHLSIYVKEVLFRGEQLPQITNRQCFPKTSDVRTHMYWATVKYCRSRIDQANIHLQEDEWKKSHSEDSFFFRPHSDDVDNEKINAGPSKTEEKGIMDEEDEEEEVLKKVVSRARSFYLYTRQHGKKGYYNGMATKSACLVLHTKRHGMPCHCSSWLSRPMWIIKLWGPLLLRMNPLCQ